MGVGGVIMEILKNNWLIGCINSRPLLGWVVNKQLEEKGLRIFTPLPFCACFTLKKTILVSISYTFLLTEALAFSQACTFMDYILLHIYV